MAVMFVVFGSSRSTGSTGPMAIRQGHLTLTSPARDSCGVHGAPSGCRGPEVRWEGRNLDRTSSAWESGHGRRRDWRGRQTPPSVLRRPNRVRCRRNRTPHGPPESSPTPPFGVRRVPGSTILIANREPDLFWRRRKKSWLLQTTTPPFPTC